ncbi:Serine protease, partial [Operophtera brumata]
MRMAQPEWSRRPPYRRGGRQSEVCRVPMDVRFTKVRGSLIHPSVVLTAAHIVASESARLRVRAGEWDTQTFKEPYPYQDRQVDTIERHKDFNKGHLFYDIALVFLSSPMELAPNVQLACLPPPQDKAFAGTRCFATGWGKDRFDRTGRYQTVMKKTSEVQVLSVKLRFSVTQLRETRLGQTFELHSSFLCAGGEEHRDTCKGDGGSPLACPVESDLPVVDRATCQTQLRETRLGHTFELHSSFLGTGTPARETGAPHSPVPS